MKSRIRTPEEIMEKEGTQHLKTPEEAKEFLKENEDRDYILRHSDSMKGGGFAFTFYDENNKIQHVPIGYTEGKGYYSLVANTSEYYPSLKNFIENYNLKSYRPREAGGLTVFSSPKGCQC